MAFALPLPVLLALDIAVLLLVADAPGPVGIAAGPMNPYGGIIMPFMGAFAPDNPAPAEEEANALAIPLPLLLAILPAVA